MQNILLLHLRQASKLTIQNISTGTGISQHRYKELEKATALIEYKEAELLGKLFKIKPVLLWQSSLQLELLRTSREQVALQKQNIQQLLKLIKHKK